MLALQLIKRKIRMEPCDNNCTPKCICLHLGVFYCKQINTNLYGDSTFYGKPIYIFEDGSCFSVLTGGASSEGSNLHFLYDYNCLGKPNKKDEDIFAFYMRYNNGKSTVFSAGGAATWNLKTREQLLDVCKNHDKDGHSPGSCSALIQYDGWEIKDDYPWIR